jgi:hypothetical protein
MNLRCLILWLLLPACAGAADGFEFVVIGDTRPKFESENFQTFERLITKINAVNPACVVNLGDLIFGYGPISEEKQWDKYQRVIQAVKPPYYQVPGNHDAHSAKARRIYLQRFGKYYSSFDYGDCHFVLLDSTENGHWGDIGPGQLEWLKADLQATKAQSVFVFLHFPLWEIERVNPRFHDLWRLTLHPLFKEHQVRAVFGGHFHCYGPTREIDGIRYFITGGGGAELLPDYRKSGGEFHFLKVKVSGRTFDVRVATDHGDLTDAEADVMGGLLFADRNSSRIGIAKDASDLRAGTTVSIRLTNPYPDPMAGQAVWTIDASAFAVQPEHAAIQVPPGASQTLQFEMKSLKASVPLPSVPWLEFSVVSGQRRYRFHRDVLFLRTLHPAFSTREVELSEREPAWTNITPIQLAASTQPAAEVRAIQTAQTLCLAIKLPPTQPKAIEDTTFQDDLQLGFALRRTGSDFGPDLIRFGLEASGLQVQINDRTPGRPAAERTHGIRSFLNNQAGAKTYLVSVPMKLLRPNRIAANNHLIMNLAFPIDDDEETPQSLSAPEANSFAYQVRYGSDGLVPVHYVELIPDRKPR